MDTVPNDTDAPTFGPEETTDHYFVMLPLWVLDAVTADAVKVYAILATYLNPNDRIVWPSRRTIADRIGVKRVETVDRYLAELDAAGAIDIRPRYRADGGRTSNAYRVNRVRPPRVETLGGAPQNAQGGAPRNRIAEVDQDRTRRDLAVSLPPSRQDAQGSLFTGGDKPVEERTGGMTALGLEQAFDDFWRAYPRKADKGKARAAFVKAVKAGVDCGHIFHGAKRYAEDPNREDAYTKYPATWLNAGAWDNGPLPPRGNRRPDSEARMRQSYDAMSRPIGQHPALTDHPAARNLRAVTDR